MRLLEDNEIYQKISTTAWGDLTVATLLGYLDAIQVTTPDNIILIQFIIKCLKTKQEEDNKSNITNIATYNQRSNYGQRLIRSPLFGGATQVISDTQSTNAIKRIGVESFVSDASGNIASDVTLVAALSGYFGVVEWIGLFSVGNAGGTATLVLEDGGGGIDNLVSGTLVAGQLDEKNQKMVLTNQTDNSAIHIDTTSSGLGNAQAYKAVYEYWYET